MADHYELLQVRRDASSAVISAAYRRLMKDAHPDRGGDGERARRLNEAYETLIDPSARNAYDASLPPESRHAARSLMPELAYRLGRSLGRRAARLRREAG